MQVYAQDLACMGMRRNSRISNVMQVLHFFTKKMSFHPLQSCRRPHENIRSGKMLASARHAHELVIASYLGW